MPAAEPVRSAPFEGVGVALVTLFDDQSELDAPATAELAAGLVDAGVRAVVVAGTTGEAASLSAEERITLLDAVRAAVPTSSRAVVVAGTGAPSSRQAAGFTATACDHGADAVLALSPPGTADSRHYYDQVAKAAGGIPVLAYHFPAVSPPGIPVSLLADLPVVGCKDSSGDADRLLATRHAYDGALYVGSSAILTLAGPLGCAGAILALANAEPELCIAAFAGDGAAQLALAEAHHEASVDFPAGVKALTARRFGTSSVTRIGS
jgi:4-hydroxy-tetrahydrodipicolinate synthase